MSEKDEKRGVLSENGTTDMVAVVEPHAISLLNRSEIESAVDIAKRYPRSIKAFSTLAMELVTFTDKIAEECIYALPRDGKTIEGPSARFAEIILHSWGNSRGGARIIEEGTEFVTAQGFFFDVERNVQIALEVKRRITDRYGRRYKPDMIGVTANAASSIAFRNSVLKGIPKAFWLPLYEEARKITVGDSKTLANKRADMIAYYQKLGVTQDAILRKLDLQGIEDIGLDELAVLKGLATAIKEGDTTVEQTFPPPPKDVPSGKGTNALKDTLFGKKE